MLSSPGHQRSAGEAPEQASPDEEILCDFRWAGLSRALRILDLKAKQYPRRAKEMTGIFKENKPFSVSPVVPEDCVDCSFTMSFMAPSIKILLLFSASGSSRGRATGNDTCLT